MALGRKHVGLTESVMDVVFGSLLNMLNG